jgi:hypothetical protein
MLAAAVAALLLALAPASIVRSTAQGQSANLPVSYDPWAELASPPPREHGALAGQLAALLGLFGAACMVVGPRAAQVIRQRRPRV